MGMEDQKQKKFVAWVLLAFGGLLMAGGVLKDDWRYAVEALIPLCAVAGMQRRIWPVVTWLLLVISIVLITEGALRDQRLYAVGALVPICFIVWHCVNARVAVRTRITAD